MGFGDVGLIANGEALSGRHAPGVGVIGKPVSFMAVKEAMDNPSDTLAVLCRLLKGGKLGNKPLLIGFGLFK